jgi:hypothetical protein
MTDFATAHTRYAHALRLAAELPREACAERMGLTPKGWDSLHRRAIAARDDWTDKPPQQPSHRKLVVRSYSAHPDNYIRIGTTVLLFSRSEGLDDLKEEWADELRSRSAEIALWRPVKGLDFPIVGECRSPVLR